MANPTTRCAGCGGICAECACPSREDAERDRIVAYLSREADVIGAASGAGADALHDAIFALRLNRHRTE